MCPFFNSVIRYQNVTVWSSWICALSNPLMILNGKKERKKFKKWNYWNEPSLYQFHKTSLFLVHVWHVYVWHICQPCVLLLLCLHLCPRSCWKLFMGFVEYSALSPWSLGNWREAKGEGPNPQGTKENDFWLSASCLLLGQRQCTTPLAEWLPAAKRRRRLCPETHQRYETRERTDAAKTAPALRENIETVSYKGVVRSIRRWLVQG